ncbi:MAG: M20/M25/M40 family metallo-hydrolase [Candidatus Micrarchaeota archaeon]
MFDDEIEATAADHLAKLVRFRTSLDHDKKMEWHSKCADYLKGELRSNGLAVKVLRKDGRRVVVGYKGNPDGETFVYNGHYDVVKDSEDWNHFYLERKTVKGRKCFVGKGTSDMKGSIAAMITALDLSSLKFAEERSMTRRVVLMFVPDEETGGLKGTGFALKKLISSGFLKPEKTRAIVGEASNLDTVTRRRARYIFRVRVARPTKAVMPDCKVIRFHGHSFHSGFFSLHRYNSGDRSHPLYDMANKYVHGEIKGIQRIEVGNFEDGKFSPVPPNVIPAYGVAFYNPKLPALKWIDGFLRLAANLSKSEIPSRFSSFGISLSCNRLSFSKKHAKLYVDLRIMNDNLPDILKRVRKYAVVSGLPANSVELVSQRRTLYSDGKWPSEIAALVEKAIGRPIHRLRENVGQSDAFLFSSAGISVLELGVDGGNEHAPQEYVTIRSLGELSRVYLSILNRFSY